jgi:hypothetical protein
MVGFFSNTLLNRAIEIEASLGHLTALLQPLLGGLCLLKLLLLDLFDQ